MNKVFKSVAGGLVFLLGTLSTALATTVYVDKSYGSGGDGSAPRPFETIGKALITDSDVIIVYPGTYSEHLQIKRSVKIYGYDGPNTTVLDASGVGGQEDAISIEKGLEITIEGLRISGGRYGIYLATAGTIRVRNCIFCSNSSHGIYLFRTETANKPSAFVYNCVFVRNGGSGIGLGSGAESYGWWYGNLTAFDNIFLLNQHYAIEFPSNGPPNTGASQIVLDYNDSADNVIGAYSAYFGSGAQIPTGNNSFSKSPNFVGGSGAVCNQDFRLAPDSPCLNVGNPGDGWLDPDGTRNDLGAFGGPGAQTFYTSPNDGPIVRELHIRQGMIPQGETLTIEATGAVR